MIGLGARRKLALVGAVAAMGTTFIPAADPTSASAFNPVKSLCAAAGFVSGAFGKVCSVVQNAGKLLTAGKKLFTGHLGSAARTLLAQSGGGIASKAGTALALAAVATWVIGGSRFALLETAHVLGSTTAPQLGSVWFSSTYWRVAGVAALLTLPFLFAAAVQAMFRSDLQLLFRAALGYLPLAGLAVGIAAPVTMLLLSVSDELSSIVSGAAGHSSGHFLSRAAGAIGGLQAADRSPFLAFLAGLLTVGAALVLWLELLMRASAVYVIVLMLPLVFAAMVWPARRVWAVRAVELLVALILSKFVIVAVLSLGGAALSRGALSGVTGLVAGVTLLTLGICAPWALMRLLPMAELAAGAAGALRGDVQLAYGHARGAYQTAAQEQPSENWPSTTAEMRRQADSAANGGPSESAASPPHTQLTVADAVANRPDAEDGTPSRSGTDRQIVHGETPSASESSGNFPASSGPASGDGSRSGGDRTDREWWEEVDDLSLETLRLDADTDWERWSESQPSPAGSGPPGPGDHAAGADREGSAGAAPEEVNRLT